jgi:hypothetical protein
MDEASDKNPQTTRLRFLIRFVIFVAAPGTLAEFAKIKYCARPNAGVDLRKFDFSLRTFGRQGDDDEAVLSNRDDLDARGLQTGEFNLPLLGNRFTPPD